ncbi:MAG: hypothetical protein LBQ79_07120 [Deltaproteobacteria bacterium]|jgi:hypothetical protein|nr:hypothetical protein [Deltaproteobacteria bacterium]
MTSYEDGPPSEVIMDALGREPSAMLGMMNAGALRWEAGPLFGQDDEWRAGAEFPAGVARSLGFHKRADWPGDLRKWIRYGAAGRSFWLLLRVMPTIFGSPDHNLRVDLHARWGDEWAELYEGTCPLWGDNGPEAAMCVLSGRERNILAGAGLLPRT